jgi:hypothetical protein
MRAESRRSLAFVTRGVALSASERAMLTRAGAIAGRVRLACRSLDPDYEHEDMDTLLAEIEHNACELAELGFVPVLERETDVPFSTVGGSEL